MQALASTQPVLSREEIIAHPDAHILMYSHESMLDNLQLDHEGFLVAIGDVLYLERFAGEPHHPVYVLNVEDI